MWSLLQSLKRHRYKRAVQEQIKAEQERVRAEQDLLQAELDLYVSEYEHYRAQVSELREKRSELSLRIWWYEKKGLTCNVMKQQLEKLDKQIFAATSKMSRAELRKLKMERKMVDA